MLKKLLLAAGLWAASFQAWGHSVWIEPGQDGQLIIRFAEPDGKFEKSPGHLDEIETPAAWKTGDKGPVRLEVQKKADHFLIVGSKISDAVQIETQFGVLAAPGKPGRLPHFYARWQPRGAGGAAPALQLDLVPTGKPGEFRVYFRGKPMPEAKATLRTPDEKEQALTADGDGVLRFSASGAGLYMLSLAHHREALPGFSRGQAYDVTSHNASVTWVEP